MRDQASSAAQPRAPKIAGPRLFFVAWRTALWSFVLGSLSSDSSASPFTTQTMSRSDPGERELTTRQAALVDSAFEEGQYESGIEMLEQLCSPTEHPSR